MTKRINTSLPVNKAHPLLRGLESWLMNMPYRWGGDGVVWPDLMRQNDASFVGEITFDSEIGGGFGSVNAIGASGQSLEIQNKIISTETNSSLFMWINTTQAQTSTGRTLYSERSSATPLWNLNHSANSIDDGESLYFIHRDDASSLTIITTGFDIADGLDHFVGVTKRGTSVKVWADGVIRGSGTLNGNDTLTVTKTEILGDNNSASSSAAANIDSLMMFKTDLSDGEAVALYTESLAGNPNTLNWSGSSYNVPSAPAAPTGFPFQRYYLGGAA